ncbi:hypothetical protein CRYUN_Cryun11dG0089500 [Craigia yunnanensis]
MVIANDSAWTRYIKRNPEARSFRGRIIRNYNELCTIFSCDDLSESSLNSTNDDVNLTANNEAADTEELVCDQSDVAKDKGKYILWTDEMDRCLTEQLVEQRNPDVSRIRGRTIDNFNELHIIVGNEQAEGHWSEAGDRVVNPIQNNEEPVEAPVQVVVDEEMGDDNIDDDMQVSSQQTRARPSSSSHSKEALKRRRTSGVILELMSAMAENIGRIADALMESKAVCLDGLFQMVQTIPDFDDDLIVDACEYLSFDEKRARMFMKLDERLRKKWLLKRMRG